MLKRENVKRLAETKPTRKADGGEITEVAGATTSGAATGFSIGGPWGALAGGIIGGGISLIGSNKRKTALRKQRKAEEKMKYDNLLQGDRNEMANYLTGYGKGFDIEALYATGGEEPATSTSPKLATSATSVTNTETLSNALKKLGLKDYIDVMKTDEDTALKIRKIIRDQVYANPDNFKEYLSDKEGVKNTINLNTLIPRLLPASGSYGMSGSSGPTYSQPEPFKLPNTFARGGEITNPVDELGGAIIPVASNASIAVGKTHDQGGIQLTDKSEVENNETIIKNKEGDLDVFSDQLGFSKLANPLVIEKGRLEKIAIGYVNKLNTVLAEYDKSNSKFAKNTKERVIEGTNAKLDSINQLIAEIDSQLTALFNQQETSQGRTDNIKTMLAKGGTIKLATGGEQVKAGLEMAAPFIDNVGNYFANKKLAKMKIPKPTLNKAYNIDPNIDISATIQALNDSSATTKKFIESNTANSGVARDIMQSVATKQATIKAGVIQDKVNKENEIKARNIANNQNVQMGNNQKVDEYANEVFQKDIQTKITNPSQNLANVESNIKDLISQNRLSKYQDKQLGLYRTLNPEGVNADLDPIIKGWSKEQYTEELKKLGKDDKYIQDRINYHIKLGTFK